MVLAIVQIIEGKDFPSNSKEIQFKATWGNDQEALLESVASDTSNVIINQEVAFDFLEDEFCLLKKEPVTIECTAMFPNLPKIFLGSLEIHLELNANPVKKWYKLKEASNQSESAPSVFLRTFCEHSGTESAAIDSERSKAEQSGITPQQYSNIPPSDEALLKPVLVNDEYFLIHCAGEKEEDQVFHRLSLTVSFAENLLYAYPSRSLWPPEKMPFEFRFNLMGSPIRFQPFDSPSNLIEIGERATAKIKCSSTSLLRFLKESMQSITISLYCEDIPVARSVIPIKERIESCQLDTHILNRLHLEPVDLPGIFPLTSSLENESSENLISMKPQIGVVISLSEIEHTEMQQKDRTFSQNPSSCVVSPAVRDLEPNPNPSNHQAKRKGEEKIQEDLLYATALELEVWKEEQKLLEQEKQERSRASYMELLNNEYLRQAALKEGALQRRMRHVEELEKQLEDVIQTARKSELELQQEKERFAKQRAQMARERKIVDTEIERITSTLTNKHKFELEAERRRHTEIVNDLRRKLKVEIEKSTGYCETIKKLEATLLNAKLT